MPPDLWFRDRAAFVTVPGSEVVYERCIRCNRKLFCHFHSLRSLVFTGNPGNAGVVRSFNLARHRFRINFKFNENDSYRFFLQACGFICSGHSRHAAFAAAFFIFYGLPQIGITIESFYAAALGLAIHNGAYISEIFRGAVQSIDQGQTEAAHAIGMNKLQSFRHVVFPQAFKNAVPALGNQFLMAILDSSLASVITIEETLTKAKEFVAATYSIFPIYTDAAIFYLLMTYCLSRLLKLLERKLKYNERRA